MEYLNLHPFVRSTVVDKALCVMVGSALGDAVGLYTEFLPKELARKAYPDGNFSLLPPLTEFHGDTHRDKSEAGDWTDDTDHALLILLSYLRHDGDLLPKDFAERLASWCEQGLRCLDRLPLGVGNTVKSVS